MLCAQDKNDQCRYKVKDTHQRNYRTRGSRDRFDPSNNHSADRKCHEQPKKPAALIKKALTAAGDVDELNVGLIGLEHIADTKAADY